MISCVRVMVCCVYIFGYCWFNIRDNSWVDSFFIVLIIVLLFLYNLVVVLKEFFKYVIVLKIILYSILLCINIILFNNMC